MAGRPWGALHQGAGSSPGSSHGKRRTCQALCVRPGTHMSCRHLWLSHVQVGSESWAGRDRLVVLSREAAGCAGPRGPGSCLWETLGLARTPESPDAPQAGHQASRALSPQRHPVTQAWGSSGAPAAGARPAVKGGGRWGPTRDSVQNVRLEGDQVVIG